jgi:Na+:H+ antiporter, NhaA family
MAVFFLLVGLEIERELYIGELAQLRQALLPLLAAAGGMIVPAAIHLAFNAGGPGQPGFGIPMATDIAFALGVLSLCGNRIPIALKIFLTALAIIDDLGAIVVIALFYSKGFSAAWFFSAIGIFLLLFIAGKRKVYFLPLYIAGGLIMWYCMMRSGIHATIAGVLLAFAIPFGKGEKSSLSSKLQGSLHFPVAFIILPLFALANTAIVFPADITGSLTTNNSLGIITGLVMGKLLGIFIFSFLSVKMGIAQLSEGVNWRQMAGLAILGGIGFTMSIFITNLAFEDPLVIIASKMSILLASLLAGIAGLAVLRITSNKELTA